MKAQENEIFVEKTVEDILIRRGRKTTLVTVSQHAMVIAALKKMTHPEMGYEGVGNIGSILVTESSKDPTPVGIMTERHCLMKLEVKGRSARNTRVKTIMHPYYLEIDIKQTLIEALKIVVHGHYRFGTYSYFPVTKDGKIITIISDRDVLIAIEQIGYIDLYRHKVGLI